MEFTSSFSQVESHPIFLLKRDICYSLIMSLGSTCTGWEQNRVQLWARIGNLVILDISCVLNHAFALNEGELLVSCMCEAGRKMNTMEWSNLVTFHGLRTGVDEGLGSAGWPSSTHVGHSLKQKLLLIALQSSARCRSIMPCSRLLSSYCSASFHFSLEENPAVQKSDAFLRHAISSWETKLLMWIA